MNLRVLEGSNILASARRPLGSSVAAVFGFGGPEARTSITMSCEFERSRPEDPTVYTLVAEAEGWAGAGGLAGAQSELEATLREFTVHLHRR